MRRKSGANITRFKMRYKTPNCWEIRRCCCRSVRMHLRMSVRSKTPSSTLHPALSTWISSVNWLRLGRCWSQEECSDIEIREQGYEPRYFYLSYKSMADERGLQFDLYHPWKYNLIAVWNGRQLVIMPLSKLSLSASWKLNIIWCLNPLNSLQRLEANRS